MGGKGVIHVEEGIGVISWVYTPSNHGESNGKEHGN